MQPNIGPCQNHNLEEWEWSKFCQTQEQRNVICKRNPAKTHMALNDFMFVEVGDDKSARIAPHKTAYIFENVSALVSGLVDFFSMTIDFATKRGDQREEEAVIFYFVSLNAVYIVWLFHGDMEGPWRSKNQRIWSDLFLLFWVI